MQLPEDHTAKEVTPEQQQPAADAPPPKVDAEHVTRVSVSIDPPPGHLELETTPALGRRGGIDWQRTHFTPGLIRGLLAAQRAVKPVGKEGQNAEGDYRYAIADSMIAEGRRALNEGDLVWLTASHQVEARDVPLAEDLDNVGEIVMESVVLHVDEQGHIGRLVTVASSDVLADDERTPDKAVRGTETYLEAYMGGDLLKIERRMPVDETPDGRSVDPLEPRATERTRTRDPKLTAAKRLVQDRWRILAELYKQRDGAVPDPQVWVRERFGDEEPLTASDHELVAKLISEEIAHLKDEAAEGGKA